MKKALILLLLGCFLSSTFLYGCSEGNRQAVAAPETTVAPETTAVPETTSAPETTAVPETTAAPETTSAGVSLDEAKSIVLSHCGLSESEVTFTKEKADRDDGRQTYDIKFTLEGRAGYDYEIDAETGDILEYSVKNYAPAEAPADDARITADEAKAIAAEKSGLPAGKVVKLEQDTENGVPVFEVTLFAEGFGEYEYDIDARTGEILEEDVELWR